MVNQWVVRITALYIFWFLCGYVLVSTGLLPAWLEWANSLYLILGGSTALVWYVRRYGARQALMLFVICGSVSYAAEWIGVHTSRWFGTYEYGLSFAPLVLGVPLAIPFAWCMLLIIAKAFAPVPPSGGAWKGLTLEQSLSAGKRELKAARKAAKRRSFWLPAVWAASMVTAIDLLLDPVAAQQRYGTWESAKNAAWNASFYSVPLSNFICWWITSLLILNMVNYLHDEYFEDYPGSDRTGTFIPMLLLLTLESLFLTLAVKSGLWWAAGLNVALLLLLFLWRSKEVPRRS
ncbi:putative membrane protein [Paenibacillus mucilaginosus]|uniref:carotenoid biosynthesis protein n=1 Tax=Paenibacillus mucilaginosus TaxID=61624 RepID=UPI003D191F2E